MRADPTTAITGLRFGPADPGTHLDAAPTPEGVLLTASAVDGSPSVRIEVDLGAAVGYWHPGIRGDRVLPPEWIEPQVTSLVRSAPVGVLYDAAGAALLGWAAAEAVAELSVRFGVSEEGKSFVVEVRSVRPLPDNLVILLDNTRSSLTTTVERLAGWLSSHCAGEPLVPPPSARVPVYSTWYTFTQDINDHLVRSEAAEAARLGCGSLFIDDGWQLHGHGRGYQGCGDWLPDEAKFADLSGTIASIHGHGLAAALWVAPLLLGTQSEAYARLAGFAPLWLPSINCYVLDPRRPEVRTFVADTCRRLVVDYGVDLLKIDFLDQAMVYGEAAGNGDLADVGQAMAAMLGQVREALSAVGRGQVAFEFRQPYVSPALSRYGEILRANDCPADAHQNLLATIDSRLFAAGRVIHADPMMWGAAGGAEAVAQQLYAGWFAVPQVSMRLSALDQPQAAALRGLLALWRDQAEVTLDGDITVEGAERGYDLVRAVRTDLGRSVIARYSPVVVELDQAPTPEVTLINATSSGRIAVRTSRPILGGVVRDVAAAEAGGVDPTGTGLVDLAVPPFGSVTLRLAGGAG
jgi:alpha-galactosidase